MDINIVPEKSRRSYYRTANPSLRVHEDIKKTLDPKVAMETEMTVCQ